VTPRPGGTDDVGHPPESSAGPSSEPADTGASVAQPAAPTAPHPAARKRRLGRWWITIHSVERWQQRYAPETSDQDAFRELTHLSVGALLIEGERRPDGKLVYLHPAYPEARFIVADDGQQDLPTLVSILDAVNCGTHRGIVARERIADSPRNRDGRTHRRRDRS